MLRTRPETGDIRTQLSPAARKPAPAGCPRQGLGEVWVVHTLSSHPHLNPHPSAEPGPQSRWPSAQDSTATRRTRPSCRNLNPGADECSVARRIGSPCAAPGIGRAKGHQAVAGSRNRLPPWKRTGLDATRRLRSGATERAHPPILGGGWSGGFHRNAPGNRHISTQRDGLRAATAGQRTNRTRSSPDAVRRPRPPWRSAERCLRPTSGCWLRPSP